MEQRHPPAFCPDHGLFPVDAFVIGSTAFQTMVIDSVASCPRCGKPSEIIPGVYERTADGLNVLVDQSISVEALQAIRSIAQRLQRGEISVATAQAEAEKIAPSAERLFDFTNWPAEAKAALFAAIVIAAGQVISARMQARPNQTVIIQTAPEQAATKSDLLSTSPLTKSSEVPIPQPKPERQK
jgi:hypothetical protein